MIRIFSRKKQKKSVSLRGDAQPRPSVEVRSPAGARDRDHDRDHDRVVREFGGPSGAEPTRYGDWERKGRCIDF